MEPLSLSSFTGDAGPKGVTLLSETSLTAVEGRMWAARAESGGAGGSGVGHGGPSSMGTRPHFIRDTCSFPKTPSSKRSFLPRSVLFPPSREGLRQTGCEPAGTSVHNMTAKAAS